MGFLGSFSDQFLPQVLKAWDNFHDMYPDGFVSREDFLASRSVIFNFCLAVSHARIKSSCFVKLMDFNVHSPMFIHHYSYLLVLELNLYRSKLISRTTKLAVR